MKRVDFLLILLLVTLGEAGVYFGYNDPREVMHATGFLLVLAAANAWANAALARRYKKLATGWPGMEGE